MTTVRSARRPGTPIHPGARLFTILLLLLAALALGGTAGLAAPEGAGTTATIMVKFKASTTAQQVTGVVNSTGGQTVRDFQRIRTQAVSVPATAKDAVLRALQNNPNVERAAALVRFSRAGAPSDPRFGDQWALTKVGWDGAYGVVAPSGSAKIAVLDTGVDAAHPDLSGVLVPGVSFTGGDSGIDPNGHGTALAGIAAASVNNGVGIAGVAYSGATVMPVQVLGADGTGTDDNVVAGVFAAIDGGAKVVLMGFSSPDYSAALADAIASAPGVVFVAATGNDGSAAPTYPAGLSGVIGVAATDQTDALMSGSNTGSALVAAPGAGILTTLPGGSYGSVSGTSAASAMVAGEAALLVANGASATDASNQIRAATDSIGQSFGRINVNTALTTTVTAPPLPAPGPTPTPGATPTYSAADQPAVVTFSTSGLPIGVSSTVTVSSYTNSGNQNNKTASGPTPLSLDTYPGTSVTFAFLATVSSGGQTYNFVSATPSSPVNSIDHTHRVTVTGNYAPSDTTPPTTSITAPADGSWKNTTSVGVTASGQDTGSGLASLLLKISSDGGSSWTDLGTACSYSNPTTLQTCSRSASGLTNGTTYQVKSTATDAAGNSAASTMVSFTIDTTLPTVNATGGKADTSVYSADTWTNQNVTVSISASDSGSGLKQIDYSATGAKTISATTSATSPVSMVVDAEGTTTISYSATDNAGNTSSTGTFIVKIDRTKPTISAAVYSGTLGSNGWYTSDVVVRFTCADGGSGISAGACPADQTLSTEGSAVSSTAQTVTDAAGNTSDPSNVVTIKLDKTGPSAALAVSAGTAGTNGWYTTNVTVSTTGSDSISGPVTCSADQYQTAETSGQVFNGSCTNDAGLSTNATPLTVKLDKTGPTAALSITGGTSGSNGWYTSDVTVHTAGTDTVSAPVTCTTDQVISTETAGQVVNGSCTNDAGLTTNASPITVKLDKTSPTSTVSFPTGGVFMYGASSVWNAGCGTAGGDICATATDNSNGSGVASVGLSVYQVASNKYWGGSSFDQSGESFLTATLGSGIWRTSFSYANLVPGSYVVRSRATDAAGNVEDPGTGVTFSVVASTSMLYNGQQFVSAGSQLVVGAKLSSNYSGCAIGKTVSFKLEPDPTSSVSSLTLGSATTDSTGQANFTVPGAQTSGWAEGAYAITATFTGTTGCNDSHDDSGTVVVTKPGGAADGGGWYTLSGSGRSNFGFTVRKVDSTCTSGCAYKGQMLLINTGKWRLKGTLSSYSKSSNSGSAGGTGSLYWWNQSLNFGQGDWQLMQSPATFSISFQDNGSNNKNTPDTFGVIINYSVPSGLPTLPTTSPLGIKGGNIVVN